MHILAYTLILAPVALALGLTSVGGPVYLAVAVVLNALFILGGVRLWRRDEEVAVDDHYAAERRFFRFSLLYLFGHFAAILAETVLQQATVRQLRQLVVIGQAMDFGFRLLVLGDV